MGNNVTVSMLRTLLTLASGGCVHASKMKTAWARSLIDDQVVRQYKHGGGFVYKVLYQDAFLSYVHEHYGVRDIEAAIKVLESGDSDRATQVDVFGSSKVQRHSSFPGFLINSLTPVDVRLNGQSLVFPPVDGSCYYVYDYKRLSIPENVIVVGLENGENLLHLSGQMWLFKKHLPVDRPWLFVCRYTQTDSLRRWLRSISNPYVHFGDLDLSGIRIYLNEFFNILGDRASLLVPEDYEERIANSPATWLYSDQIGSVKNLDIADPHVRPLWDCIHKYHRGYEQEGYIR